MILRMSTLFVRTLRDDPADAEVQSHRLLVRAGYIRRAAPGIYTWLPLGLRVLRRIESIIREEMDAIGAQELSFPALLPREPYEATNRWTEYGDGIFRLKDRKGADYLLGPTHEEMFTLVVKDLYSSYKDLPLSIYQIQTKYRDEARPRAGLLRGREFIDEGLLLLRRRRRRPRRELPEAPRRLHPDLRPARVLLRHRLGPLRCDGRLEVRGVPRPRRDRRGHLRAVHRVRLRRQRRGRAASPAPARAVRRRTGRARRGDARHPDDPDPRRPPRRGVPPRRPRPGPAATPSRTSCWSSSTPTAPPSRWPSACPATARSTRSGSRRTSTPRSSGPSARPTSRRTPTWSRATSAPARSARESKTGIRYLVDPRVVEGTRWVTGADVDGSHVLDLVAGRDFTPDGTIEAAEVRAGDPCPRVRRRHARDRARHRDGPHLPARPQVRRRPRPQGARRERQARHRHHGLLRHRPLARRRGHRRGHPRRGRACAGPATSPPPTSTSSPPARTTPSSPRPRRSPASSTPPASRSSTTTARGKISPGVKFKDAELIGVPTIVVVGKGFADGVVEVKDRRTGEREDVAADRGRRPPGRARPRLSRASDRRACESPTIERGDSAARTSAVGAARGPRRARRRGGLLERADEHVGQRPHRLRGDDVPASTRPCDDASTQADAVAAADLAPPLPAQRGGRLDAARCGAPRARRRRASQAVDVGVQLRPAGRSRAPGGRPRRAGRRSPARPARRRRRTAPPCRRTGGRARRG